MAKKSTKKMILTADVLETDADRYAEIDTGVIDALPCCRKCGDDLTPDQVGSLSPEGRPTCKVCLEKTSDPGYRAFCDAMENAVEVVDGDVMGAIAELQSPLRAMGYQPPANTPVVIATRNTTARANKALAPKEAPGDVPPAPKAARAKKREVDAEKAASATQQWETVTRLHSEGKGRPEIAKETGLTYSRLTFILWHKKYGVDAIPGMAEYDAAKKAAAQKRYLADVAAKREG